MPRPLPPVHTSVYRHPSVVTFSLREVCKPAVVVCYSGDGGVAGEQHDGRRRHAAPHHGERRGPVTLRPPVWTRTRRIVMPTWGYPVHTEKRKTIPRKKNKRHKQEEGEEELKEEKKRKNKLLLIQYLLVSVFFIFLFYCAFSPPTPAFYSLFIFFFLHFILLPPLSLCLIAGWLTLIRSSHTLTWGILLSGKKNLSSIHTAEIHILSMFTSGDRRYRRRGK